MRTEGLLRQKPDRARATGRAENWQTAEGFVSKPRQGNHHHSDAARRLCRRLRQDQMIGLSAHCLAISALPTPSPSSFWSLCMATVTRSKRPVNSKVGATVGAFYSRFESKEAYFNALIEVAARDGETRLSQMVRDQQLPDASLGKLCRLLVHGIIGWIRNHE